MFSLVLLVIPSSMFPKQSVLEHTIGLCSLDHLFMRNNIRNCSNSVNKVQSLCGEGYLPKLDEFIALNQNKHKVTEFPQIYLR